MLLPVIAFVAMHLFVAVLADIPVEKDPFGWASWDGFKMMCRDLDLKPAENVDFLRDNAATIAESPRQDLQIRLPVGYCTQLACDDSSAILYCKHAHGDGITGDGNTGQYKSVSVSIDFNKVQEAAWNIMERCVVTGNSYGKAIHNTVSGQVWHDGEQFSVAITKQQCHGENEMTYGTQDGDPVSMGNDDTPSPSATTKASHTPAASEAPSTTSTHSTKTAKPKSHKTASHEPPTTTHKAPETNTNRPTDQDWLMTTCFSDSPNRVVYSHKIVQDNIDWIGANMKTVPRNPGKGNCTRLACHRNSAIFFCNDDGDLQSDLENTDQVVDGARKVADTCRLELDGKSILGNGYGDMIAGKIIHKDNWRVVVQSSPCDTQAQGDQVTAQIAPDDNISKTTPSGKDKKTKSESKSTINTAIDFLRPKTRDNGLTIRGAIRAARACKASAPPSKKVVRRDPPPGYVRHSCWGSLKNASFPSPIEAGIHYLNNLDGRPGINAGKCDQVSCSWDTAISWCSTNLERFELDSFKQIAAGAQFILDNCDVPADTCWVGHDISGQVWFKDKWSVVVSGSLEHC